MSKTTLSLKQEQICHFIFEYTSIKKGSPTNREIGHAIGFVGLKGNVHSGQVAHHLSILEDRGFIHREPRKARTIRLTPMGYQFVEQKWCRTHDRQTRALSPGRNLGEIPLLGTTAAGKPRTFFQEGNQTINMFQDFDAENIYALIVEGDSMIDDHICTGDYVIMNNQTSYKNGDIVVAVSSDQSLNEVTLKRFYKEKDQIRLQPSNSRMAPLLISPHEWTEKWSIQGAVIAILRRNVNG